MSNAMGPGDAQARDQQFVQLVEKYQTVLLRTCFLYLKDRTLAEDAVQDTFLKAYRSLNSFRGESNERTWLMRIAVNTCRDLYRSGWFRMMDRRYTPDMLPQAGAPFEQGDDEVVTAVMNLPPKLREVILLHYYHGFTTLEIADSLGIAQSSVSGRLKRARDKLRALLEGSERHA